MKNVFRNCSLLFLSLVLILLSSCQTTGLENGQGGITDDTQKFLGEWSVSDQPARINYSVTIEQSPTNSDQVIMKNFGDMGNSATGLVVNNTVVIDKQSIGNEFTAEGTGTYINKNRLEFDFLLSDGIDTEERLAIFTK